MHIDLRLLSWGGVIFLGVVEWSGGGGERATAPLPPPVPLLLLLEVVGAASRDLTLVGRFAS